MLKALKDEAESKQQSARDAPLSRTKTKRRQQRQQKKVQKTPAPVKKSLPIKITSVAVDDQNDQDSNLSSILESPSKIMSKIAEIQTEKNHHHVGHNPLLDPKGMNNSLLFYMIIATIVIGPLMAIFVTLNIQNDSKINNRGVKSLAQPSQDPYKTTQIELDSESSSEDDNEKDDTPKVKLVNREDDDDEKGKECEKRSSKFSRTSSSTSTGSL